MPKNKLFFNFFQHLKTLNVVLFATFNIVIIEQILFVNEYEHFYERN
jgi:hypothetical protein